MTFEKSCPKSIAVLLIILIALFGLGFATTDNIEYAEAAAEIVYLGGTPIGIVVKSDNLTVAGFVEIISLDDATCPALKGGIARGDVLLEINGNTLHSAEDIAKNVSKSPNCVEIKIKRGEESFKVKVSPVLDPATGEYKLGLLVKNEIAGVGTVTFIKEDGRVCTLGHCIADPETDNESEYQKGNFYKCRILGSVRGKENEAGVLKGVFDRNSEKIGEINKNNAFGVYGKAEGSALFAARPKVSVAAKDEVHPGKAHIYTTINGVNPQKYEIEIVKTEGQDVPQVKGMIIRVTDRRLLETTGGIVQGMSGSPIVQDGKLVGAVTHVFLNDAAYGYGIYADWLMRQ